MTPNDATPPLSADGKAPGLSPLLKLVILSVLVAVFSLTGVVLVPAGDHELRILRGTGVAVAGILVLGNRFWPGVFAGAMAGQLVLAAQGYANIAGNGSLPAMLTLAAASAVQAWAGAAALRRLFGDPVRLAGPRDLLVVALVIVPLSSAILPSVATVLIALVAPGAPVQTGWFWLVWWIGNMIGFVLAVPVALLGPWSRGGPALYWKGVALPRYSVAATVYLALAVLTTFVAWHQVSRLGARSDAAQFEMLSRDSVHALQRRLEAFTLGISGGIGLFDASDHVSASDWREFAEAFRNFEGVSGMNGLGFITPVPPGGAEAFLAQARADGIADLSIRPAISAGEMFVIKYIEPQAPNRAALGLDIAFEQGRREAAIAARDSGEVTISRPVSLVQDIAKGTGFLLLAPVYDHPGIPATVAERRASLVGWIYAPVIMERLLNALNEHANPFSAISIYDGPEIAPAHRYYESHPPDGRTPRFRYVERIAVYGRTWTVLWESTPAFEAQIWTVEPLGVLLVGLSFSVLLGVFLTSLMRREELVQGTVALRTRELASQVEENRSIIQTALTKIALLDGAGTILSFNDALPRLLRRSPVDMTGASFPALLEGQLDEYFASAGQERQPPTYRGALRAHTAEGQPLLLDVQVNPWRNSDGKRRYTVVMRDITEIRRISDQLRTTQHRLDLALTGARIGVFDIDLHTGKSIVSRTWLDLLGLDHSAAADAQDYWLRHIHPEDLPTVQEADRACIAGERDASVSEYRIRMGDGSWRWMRSNAVAEDRDATGRAWRLIGVQTDVTDRRQVDELKKQFVSTVSHELRTPLTSINGSVSLLLNTMSDGLPDSARRMLTIAQKNCDRLISLVNDILDLDKLDAELQRPDMVATDISALLRHTVLVNQPFAARFDVTYRFTCDAPGTVVRLDENRFHQIMANLLSNAAKFSPRGGVVDVCLKRGPGEARISVTNAGKGIPAQFRDRIFRPFSQVDSASNRQSEGSGLGLHIAKRITEQLGGAIGFESEPGVATTFWVTLPAEATAPPDLAAPAALRGDAPLPMRPARVLHVEQDTDISEVLAAAFGPTARVINAMDRDSARRLLSREGFDLVVLDREMEDEGAAALLCELASRHPDMPVVTLTAAARNGTDPRVVETFVKSRVTLHEVATRCLHIIATRPPPAARVRTG